MEDEVAKVASTFQGDYLISVKLEGSDKTFMMQKALLCDASEYFVAALNGSFREGVERTISLPGCSAETFELFLFWLLRNKLPHSAPDKPTEGTLARDRQLLLSRLWSFGQICLIPKLQNDAMRALLELFHGNQVDILVVEEVVAREPIDSVLRDAVMRDVLNDYICNDHTEMQKDRLGAIPGFMSDLTGRLFDCFDIRDSDDSCTCEPRCFGVRERADVEDLWMVKE
ncbi:hypothetical protein LTR08_007349 [Meristemomyces frigidus]|nr:hypothetical protein LTR08_007349 [Meristemomyces frigidus]